MPQVLIAQYCTWIAHALMSQNGGRHVAVGFDNTELAGIGIDTRYHGVDPATATVNLLQNGYRLMPRNNFFIATSYVPTEACLGMANLMGARYIFYYNGAQFRMRQVTPPGPETPVNPQFRQVTLPNVPANFANLGPGQRRAVAAHWLDHLDDTYLDPHVRDFKIFADHALPYRNLPLPPQIGDLPPPAGAIGTIMSARRRRILMLAAQCLVAAVGFRDRRGAGLSFSGLASRTGHVAGHSIACVVADANGEIITWGINQVQRNPTLHAETYAVMHWMHLMGNQGFPQNAEMFTTLMSCYMCAGVIATAAPGITVHYSMNDPIMQNNALARQVNGSREQPFNGSQFLAVDVQQQFGRNFAPNARTTDSLNSSRGMLIFTEAVHNFKRMRHYDAGTQDDQYVYAQAAGLINSICPNLV